MNLQWRLNLKAAIEVKSREEAKLIVKALENPTAKALLLIIGALSDLPSNESKLRVLKIVQEEMGIDYV